MIVFVVVLIVGNLRLVVRGTGTMNRLPCYSQVLAVFALQD